MTDNTIPTESTWKDKTKAVFSIGRDWWKIVSGGLSDTEKRLVEAGLTQAEAVHFVNQAAVTPTEEWLITKGAHPYAARELAKTPLTDFETALIIKGVAPVAARKEAQKVASEYDVKAAIVSMAETSNHPAFTKPTRLTEELSLAIRRSGITKAELHDVEFELRDGQKVSLADGLLAQTVTQHQPTASRMVVVGAGASPAAAPASTETQTGATLVITSTAAAIKQSADDVVKAPALAAVKPAINNTILQLMSGKKLDKAAVESLQTSLNQQGFDCGKADGAAGALTWKGIAAYAKAGHLTGERVDRQQLYAMEEALKVVGYKQVKTDGIIDDATKRAVEQFFRVRKATLGDFRPNEASAPDFAALAAIQSGYNQKRGLAPAAR